MKYKIMHGTGTFAKLKVLEKQMDRVCKARNKVLKELGAERFATLRGVLCGGMVAVELAAKPEGFKVYDRSHPRFFAPKADNTEWSAKFNDLPTLPYSALNDIVGFKSGQMTGHESGGFAIHRCPGIEFGKTVILLETDAKAKYSPENADIVEILESEYVRLSEAIDKKKA